MKTEIKQAVVHAKALAELLNVLTHVELFEVVQQLLVIKMNPESGERTRDLVKALIHLIGEWMVK